MPRTVLLLQYYHLHNHSVRFHLLNFKTYSEHQIQVKSQRNTLNNDNGGEKTDTNLIK
jgi:hypothetical protein